ncbi:MAG: ABC transporter ATP-binding protein [Rhodospirillaceae bacterium]|nr:ABC transporter ATP-binding protein [Rhodospirillaceae bacterium]
MTNSIPVSEQDRPAIDIRNVSKVFNIYRRPIDRLKQAIFRGHRNFFTPFPAVYDVSFTVPRRQTVGIVGENGSGKSTLLQIITGLLSQTTGEVAVEGRVSALLELGAGFNPVFTGRENIVMNAAILGLTEAEVAERFDEIVKFSGLEEFLDRPVATYSSGMFVRLGFSVAVCADPDILIVDEALAVGDEAFQRKCFSRIEEMQKRGATILFVSHAAGMITQLCDRALLLDRGEIIADGAPKGVIAQYRRLSHAHGGDREQVRAEIKGADFTVEQAFEDNIAEMKSQSQVEYVRDGAQIHNVRIESLEGRPLNVLLRGRRYVFAYDVTFERNAEAVRFGMFIKTFQGLELGGRTSSDRKLRAPDYPCGATISLAYEFSCNLGPGTYFLNVGVNAIVDGERRSLHRIMDAFMFQVAPDEEDTLNGSVDFEIQVTARHKLD